MIGILMIVSHYIFKTTWKIVVFIVRMYFFKLYNIIYYTKHERFGIWIGIIYIQNVFSYFQIFDGSNKDAPFLGRFCHNKGNFTINSSGSSLYFVYQTSRDSTKQDFQLIYETKEAERDRKIKLVVVFAVTSITT